MQIATILIPQNKLFPLTYIVPDGMEIQAGNVVVVPYRNSFRYGVTIRLNEHIPKDLKLKTIYSKLSYNFDLRLIQFIDRAAKYYFSEMGSVLKLSMPIQLIDEKTGEELIDKQKYKSYDLELTLASLSYSQNNVFQKILSSIKQPENLKPIVLNGITGSGKTEVYFHLIAYIITLGKQALFMLPEIALSNQILSRFKQRFGIEPAVWNSSISPSKKRKIFKAVMDGSAQIIIGTRSALFLPYNDLSLIIVDEEHDSSYKQDDHILYNARDMAVLRSAIFQTPIVLGSATPSLETFYNIKTHKYIEFVLESRFGDANLPNVVTIDMKGKKENGKWISTDLNHAIANTISSGQQVLLFLNRKGYAPLLLCSNCGDRKICKYCSTTLVYHKFSKKLLCHQCGFETRYTEDCNACGSINSMVACGPGIERLEEEVKELFPTAKIQIMTKSESGKKHMKNILASIEEGDVDIIIGTQIITKGYHFPKLTCVGVIDTDIGMNGEDLRAPEKSFQLLHQVCGRAGREDLHGTMYLQTYNPDSQFIKFLVQHQMLEFMQNELDLRQKYAMPPFTRMVMIVISHKDELMSKKLAQEFCSKIKFSKELNILGPSQAALFKVNNKYRYKILIIVDKKINIQQYLKNAVNLIPQKYHSYIKIDIDPHHFY
jgi:primosomal protein N' (replication factor Y)